MESVRGIKGEVFSLFGKRFKEPDSNIPTLDGIEFKALTIAKSHLIKEPFTKVKIKAAMWDCDGNKSSEPNGFNLEFIKRSWSVLKSDLLGFL